MIEFDVQLTKDDKLVIMHDARVDSTTNGSGRVIKLTLDEVRSLDAGSWKSEKYVGEKAPTLKEVLQIMPPTIWLNIHLKGNKKLGIETAKLVVSENRIHQAIIACKRRAAKGVQKVNSEIKICNMEHLSSRERYVDKTIAKKDPFIQLKKSRNNGFLKNDIELLKKNKIVINYVQANEAQEISELLNLGVDFIFTDDLGTMVRAFDNYMALRKMNVEMKTIK